MHQWLSTLFDICVVINFISLLVVMRLAADCRRVNQFISTLTEHESPPIKKDHIAYNKHIAYIKISPYYNADNLYTEIDNAVFVIYPECCFLDCVLISTRYHHILTYLKIRTYIF